MKVYLRLKGGPKSGHHGHAGRPGQVGGSVLSRVAGLPSATSIDWIRDNNALLHSRGIQNAVVPDDWSHFPVVASGVSAEKLRKEGKFGLCAHHSMEGCKQDPDLAVAVGLVYSEQEVDNIRNFDQDNYWSHSYNGTVHVWNVDTEGRVVDRTFGSRGARREVYVGEIVPKTILDGFDTDAGLLSYAHDMVQSAYPDIPDDVIRAKFDAWRKVRDAG